MQNADAIITTMEDNIGQVIVTQSLDNDSNSENHENLLGESEENIQKKCYILRKLLAHQIKPELGCLPQTIRALPRMKPFRAFGSILDKSIPFTELFSHPCTIETKPISHSESSTFQLLRPLNCEKQNISTKNNHAPSPLVKNDHINIFGAMAVSIKADFLQNCAAALLRNRVSKSIDF